MHYMGISLSKSFVSKTGKILTALVSM